MSTQITCDDCYKRLPFNSLPTFFVMAPDSYAIIHSVHLCDKCIGIKKSLSVYIENPYYVAPLEPKEACTGE